MTLTSDITAFCRFSPVFYELGMKAVKDRLWEETLDELEFANARGILKSTST